MQYFQRLADIPASPFESNAQTLSSEVLSLQGEIRKKRSELALAVNGYGIEIPKKIAGHGVQLESTWFSLPESGAPIVHIEAFATSHSNAETPALDVLCVHQDGKISCYDAALTNRRWGPQIGFIPDGSQAREVHVVQASSISVLKAKKTFLKDRDDVLGILHADAGRFAPNLLLLVRRPVQYPGKSEQRRLLFHILAYKSLQTDAPGASRSSNKPVQEILSLSIPEPIIQASKRTDFRMHNPSGCLYQGTGRQLFIYDLTALTPQLVKTITFDNQQMILSYATVSPDTVALLSGNSVAIMNTGFSSHRAKYEFTTPNGSPSPFPVDAQILTYHDPSASAIVLIGRRLMAVNLSEAIPSRQETRKRKRNGLLIDSIGRGSLSASIRPPPSKRKVVSSLALGHLVDPHHEATEWELQEKAFNELLENGDPRELDRQIASKLDVLLKPNIPNTDKGKVISTTYAPPRIVDFAISKMFSTSPRNGTDPQVVQKEGELHVNSNFAQTWQGLVRRGFISTERIEASLRRQDLLSLKNNLKDGGLIRALTKQDESLATLSDLLKSPCPIQISEVCYALKIVVARFSLLAAGHGEKLLSKGDEPTSLNNISVDEMDLGDADPTATPSQSSRNSDHLHTLLDVIIARCDACPTPTLTKAFKHQLSKTELQTLVNLLRTKLRQDGWLSSYIEDPLAVDAESQHMDRGISRIGKLLNCAVDSLGTGGWLLSNDLGDNAAEPVETISNMQAEISTALEGIWEANYLRALLGEQLICGKGALKSQNTRVQPVLDWRGTPKTALPLGLKLEQEIPLMKVGAGGELQKRSRRDIGKLKSRKVPKYSFEQIAI
ncbi:MAG: hypothetical protein Q9169_000993 [Polycauliona sp. 2 TL-2023]